jgi:hypothetical protein
VLSTNGDGALDSMELMQQQITTMLICRGAKEGDYFLAETAELRGDRYA